MMAADGRTVWMRESGTMLVENGQPIAMRGIFQDVTRQKLDAQQLDKLNRQLMDTSRQAGMAEVATGVLHNVGNVLNSVSVSATVVADRLRRSKVVNLCRATAILREQNGHLVEFLTTDPKGKLLPAYLGTVADQLAGEQTKLIALMTTVGQHIEHIKEIVAMQQSYAKVSGVYETLAVAGLVEDALRMNAAAFDRHHIDLVREFDKDIPAVCVDRHKVLQILINLFRNAKYAMAARSGNDKRIVIRVGMASPDRVKITVGDNGVGIAPEHLTSIFNHGFTTKKDGHGFGLHSGANAAKEMGGTLMAHSDGPGQGAEFTLELPVAAPAPQKDHLVTQGKV
jgi:signal transduction histidine kinase